MLSGLEVYTDGFEATNHREWRNVPQQIRVNPPPSMLISGPASVRVDPRPAVPNRTSETTYGLTP
jgi:hypothetical protein